MVPPIKSSKIFKLKHDNIPFLTLQEYEKEAKKYIKKFASRALSSFLIRDDESISFIMDSLIRADWRYNPDTGLTREDYRAQCSKWGIKDLIKKYKTEKNKTIDYASPSGIAEDDYELIDKIFSCGTLMEFERDILRQHFFENRSIKQISKLNKCGDQKIVETIEGSLQKIREWFPCGL